MKLKKSMYNIAVETRENGDVLYYNSASGAMAWLNNDIQNAFLMDDMSGIEKEDYYSLLFQNGFVVDVAIDEYSRYLFKSREFIMELNSDFVSYTIALTMECNLRCVYCFESGRNYGVASNDTLDDIYDFITSQVTILKKRKLHITWFGGEPMLSYDQMIKLSTRLILFCKRNDVIYDASMITNGTLLDEEKLSELIVAHKLENIQITLDGDFDFYRKYKNASMNQFTRVIDNIRLIGKNKKVNLTLRLNTCKDNKDSLIHIVNEIMKDSEFHCYLYAGKMMNYGSDLFEEMEEKEFFEFEKKINLIASKFPEYKNITKKRLKPKGANCGALSCNRCVIDARGRLYRCEHHINDCKFAVGDVKQGFYRNEIDSRFLFSDYPSKCRKCSVFPVCMGGCTSDRIIYGKEMDCKIMYNMVINNVKIINNI